MDEKNNIPNHESQPVKPTEKQFYNGYSDQQNPNQQYSNQTFGNQNNPYPNQNGPVNQFNYNGWNPNVNPNFVRNEANGYAVASLILGILSLPNMFCYGIVGALLGLIAIVLACISKPKTGPYQNKFSSVALGGFVTGLISLIVGLIIFVLIIIAITQLSNSTDSSWNFEYHYTLMNRFLSLFTL